MEAASIAALYGRTGWDPSRPAPRGLPSTGVAALSQLPEADRKKVLMKGMGKITAVGVSACLPIHVGEGKAQHGANRCRRWRGLWCFSSFWAAARGLYAAPVRAGRRSVRGIARNRGVCIAGVPRHSEGDTSLK